MQKFYYMDKNEIMTVVEYDYGKDIVKIKNFTNDILSRAFGIEENPTIKDLEKLFERRCFPRERRDANELLKGLGVPFYNPYMIVLKTHGRMWDDYFWIKFEGEDLDYERDIKLRG